MSENSCKIRFTYNGKTQDLYEKYDGHPRAIGKDILKELFYLIKRFHGDVSAACSYLRTLLENIPFTGYCFVRNQESNGFLGVEKLFTAQNSIIHCFQSPSDHGYGCYMHVRYNWEINLDQFLFIHKTRVENHTFQMKQIYRLLLFKRLRKKRVCQWVNELYYQSRYFNGFTRHCNAITIQKAFRNHLSMLRELQPGTGVLFLLAQKRFQERMGISSL